MPTRSTDQQLHRMQLNYTNAKSVICDVSFVFDGFDVGDEVALIDLNDDHPCPATGLLQCGCI
jgi:hypothetical protein